MIKFAKSKLFDKTFEKQQKPIKEKFKNFVLWKQENPNKPFGGSDYSFAKNGVLAGYSHAHLNRDLSLIYKFENGVIYLYGVFSHADSGTGTPSNVNKQQSLKSKLDNQNF